MNTYLNCAFDSMFISRHVCYWEWLQTLVFVEYQETFYQNRRDIWILNDFIHLAFKQTIKRLASLAKCLRCIVRYYFHGTFNCMLLSCHVRVWKGVHNLYLSFFKEHLALKKGNMWSISDSNGTRTNNHFLQKNKQSFGKSVQMIEVCCEYLYVQCVWLDVFMKSWRSFTENPNSIFPLMSRNSLLVTGTISEV